MNVVIYARYSSHSQTEQSIEGQLQTLRLSTPETTATSSLGNTSTAPRAASATAALSSSG